MIVFYILLFLLITLSILALIRNTVCHENRARIISAIFRYRNDMIDKHDYRENINGPVYEVDYSDMEDYAETYKRIFDWGCKNILPPEKYAIIKDHIR